MWPTCDQLLFWIGRQASPPSEEPSSLKGLTGGWQSVRLDKVGSVSGSDLFETDWDDRLLEEQYRRFHNGS